MLFIRPTTCRADFTRITMRSILLSDLLRRGQSSRLYQNLVKDREIFTSISSFVMGTIDPGLLVVSGRVKDGIALKDAEEEVDKVLERPSE